MLCVGFFFVVVVCFNLGFHMNAAVVEALLVLVHVISCLASTDGSQYSWVPEVHSPTKKTFVKPVLSFFLSQ